MGKASRKIYILIGSLLAVLMAVIWYLTFYRSSDVISNEAIRDTSIIYLNELAKQKENQLQLNLEAQSRQLSVTVKTLTEKDVENKETLRSFLKDMKETNEFDFLGFIDAQGMVYTDDASFSGISKLSFVSDEFDKGGIAFNNNIGDENLVMVYVPVNGFSYEGEELVSLVAGINVETIAKRVSLSDAGTKNFSEVVLNNGSHVMCTPDDPHGGGSNFLSIMKEKAEFEDGFSYEQMENAMQTGQSSFSEYVFEGEKYFTYLIPIENTDWYLLSTIPCEIVSEGVTSVRDALTRNSLAQLAIITFVLVITFVIYIRMQKKQEKSYLAQIEAEESNRAKSVFLSQMSHDIRTPMNAVIGFTNLALKEKNLSDSVQTYLMKISTASNHLLNLINEVLEMSRIESGRLELNKTECNITSVFDSVDDMIRRQTEEKKQDFSIHISVTDRFVYCDKVRIGQVLQNLVGNAVKYTPEGGKISVFVKQIVASKEGCGGYEIRVSDNGIGMSAEFARRVFEPFERERTSTVSGIEGTGLGLAIVKQIIDAMEGHIFVNTVPNEGTTFTVYLELPIVEPQVAEELSRLEEKKSQWSSEELKAYFNGKSLLLVEDNDFNREIAQTVLEEVGFVVETAENGRDAIRKVKESAKDHYTAILMDIQMPVMDGYEASKKIRALEDERAAVKIIAVTANAFESDKEAAYQAGMDAHITKPIDVEELYQTLASFI